MVVLVFGNVVLRYVFNSGITISEELSRWLMVWLTFLGAIVALREHSHLGVDTLVRALPPAGKRICFVVLGLGLAALSLEVGSRVTDSLPGVVSPAQAVVGRPLTPVSVAGVARRTVRRCAVGVYNC